MNAKRPCPCPVGCAPVRRYPTAVAVLALVSWPGPPVAAAAGPSAAQLYDQNCAVCHGADGTGGMPGVPDLTVASGPLVKPVDTLLAEVQKGIRTPGGMGMPPKGGNPELTEAQLRAVLHYMKHEFAR